MGVDQTTYDRWWKIHLQVARGEALTDADRAFYETTQQRLEVDERLRDPVPDVRALKARLKALEAERQALKARRQRLDGEITTLEASLPASTGQPLGVEG